MFFDFLGLDAAGQDGELLQYLAGKIEREQVGWLGRTMVGKVLASTNRLVVNDDCRWNSYPALAETGFRFVRVRTAPELRSRRRRADHTPADPGHPVEQGFEHFRADFEIDNDGPLELTLKQVDQLVVDLAGGTDTTEGGEEIRPDRWRGEDR